MYTTDPHHPDRYYVSQLRETGSEWAFVALYERYKEKLLYYCLKFVKSESLAEELMHDVWLKIWEKREDLQPEQCFSAYLHTIAKHHVFNFLKRAAKLKAINEEIMRAASYSENQTYQQLFANETEALLQQAVHLLPPQRRRVFTLVKFDGLSYEDAAAYMGISKNAIKEHIVKSTKAIKLYLKLHTDITLGWLSVLHYFWFE
ncbi:RNA polymerase sigma-70 factor [Rhabdobacter roseus]|uniref:RNA polymerase sigma-70 factor (ECF subfamily) n=1 Tax=Rhabdobacter roseus TaxID=1655419 RepID=A0A840U058_9BACT|nr:RNA polymerase sigma-70 factor (ECF subfamily) [Rhabdobacter roseus]